MIDGKAARALEPQLQCRGAMRSPETGILDVHGYMLALEGDLEDAGGAIAFNTPVARRGRGKTGNGRCASVAPRRTPSPSTR